MSTVDTFENGALSYDTGLPSPVCMMYCESPMTVSVYKPDKNDVKTLKITVMLFNFVFLRLF